MQATYLTHGTHSVTALLILVIVASLQQFGTGESHVIFISPSCTDYNVQRNICLSLNQLVNHTDSLQGNTSLMFLHGNHYLSHEISISNIDQLSLITANTNGGDNDYDIKCLPNASFQFFNMSYLLIQGLRFLGCGNNEFSFIKNLSIENCTFQGWDRSATALELEESNVNIAYSHFKLNTASKCLLHPNIPAPHHCMYLRVGGAIYAENCNVTIIESHFRDNTAEKGGAIFCLSCNKVIILNSTFINNRAAAINTNINNSNCPPHSNDTSSLKYTGDTVWMHENQFQEPSCNVSEFETIFTSGGAIASLFSTLRIHRSFFVNNSCNDGGYAGVISVEGQSSIEIYDSEFCSNRAVRFGGVMIVFGQSRARMEHCIFNNSVSTLGGVMVLSQSNMTIIKDCSLHNNTALRFHGGVIMSVDTQLKLLWSQFTSNNAARGGGTLYAVNTNVTIKSCVFTSNRANEGGSIMAISYSLLEISGKTDIENNTASIGGAIYAIQSSLYTFNVTTVTSNTASDSGGAIYLFHSELHCMKEGTLNMTDNRAEYNGGGIHAINSLITVHHDRSYSRESGMYFVTNEAKRGGGIYLESIAQLRVKKSGTVAIKKSIEIYFTHNKATENGEAIYVKDETYFDVCSRGLNTSSRALGSECFIQVTTTAYTYNQFYQFLSISFVPNDLNRSLIYGGLLDRCTLDSQSEVETSMDGHNRVDVDGVSYLKRISNISVSDIHLIVRSKPVRLCHCDNEPNCSNTSKEIKVLKGQKFHLSFVAVDQVNNTVGNVMVHTFLQQPESGLGYGQQTQLTGSSCTNLSFKVTSPHSTELLILYGEGPCRNTTRSQLRVNVTFLPCTCPKIGFQPKQETENNTNSCECVCNKWLTRYSWVTENGCNYQTGSLTKKGNSWLAYDSSTCRFVTYRFCPLDYCDQGNNTSINFNRGNGTDDSQCANNRSGILCGRCRPGLSLSLGSSHCLQCSHTWYKMFVVLLMTAMLIGIALVALLMILNLTVASGNLNGVIFYANILGANGGTISSKFPSILMSWLNLEVGFDVCFFEGMDTYWKTWLQLAFPSYVILLVVFVILLSECSMRFSRLIAKRNPVATLATLILLSYTKFLQTTITALSLAKLKYCDGSHRWVWLADGNVEYARGKHVVLIVAAIFILILGTAYTTLLFFWQWILPHQNKCFFKWARSQRLCHFLEPYHAPYNFEHRYWTGLLLFVRVLLYIIFSLNVSSDPGINLLAITVIVSALIFWRAHIGRLYKRKVVDWIEMTCYLNIALYSAIQQYLVKTGSNTFTASSITECISTMFILVPLAAVVLYHIWTEVCLSFINLCKHKQEERQNDDADGLACYPPAVGIEPIKPTMSVVEGPSQLTPHPLITRGQDFNDCDSDSCPSRGTKEARHAKRGQESEDDDISVTSSDSLKPLLEGHKAHSHNYAFL